MHPPHLPDEDDERWAGHDDPPMVRQVPKNWVTRFLQFILRFWHPKDIEPPKVDPELPTLTGVERSAEVFRYSMLSTEYWLSPKGLLREWLRFNARLASILIIPMLLVVPIITFTLGQFKTWAELLAVTTSTMVLFPLSALLVVALISALVFACRSLARRNPRRDPYYYQ
jgi:hypothetical protein